MQRQAKIGKVKVGGGNPIVLIAGPCVIESEASCIDHAAAISEIAKDAGMDFVFKASYDKANRSSIRSFRGPGLVKGLKILSKVKKRIGVPVISDVHSPDEAKTAGRTLDAVQIPAFLSRQTDLLVAAAKTKKCVVVKKGQFLAPGDMKNIVEKIERAGSKNIILTERGTSFGYNMLVSDFRAILIMKKLGFPVCFDASHSVQIPGGLGTKSGGTSEFIKPLSYAAVSCGVDALFVEVHENPRQAKSDGPNMLRLKELGAFLKKVKKLESVI